MQRRFTLIEMLVVVGIIGILAGLLIPAVNRARESAKAVTCLNNYRQISGAIHNYTADHAGRLPGTGVALPYDARHQGSMSLIDFLGWIDNNYIHSFVITKISGNTATVDKTKGGDVWRCEKFMQLRSLTNIDKNRCGFFLGATSNSLYDNDLFLRSVGAARYKPFRTIDNLKLPAPPSCIPMVTEMSAGSWHLGGSTTAQKPYEQIPQPHNNTFTEAWLDGHVTQESAPQGYTLNHFPTSENDKWKKED